MGCEEFGGLPMGITRKISRAKPAAVPINVFIVFLYNLLSDVVGGIEVTLSERR